MQNDLIIDVQDLQKSFAGKAAVNGATLSVKRGEIFGFLGPNGSGKTTTLRMLCGLMTPDAGSGQCMGYDVLTQSDLIRLQVGYMTQKNQLPQVSQAFSEKPIDERTFVKTIPLGNCTVEFANSSGGIARQYQDLPLFELAAEEEEKIAEIAGKLREDRDQILITNLAFDGDTLRVSAVRAKYSVLRALAKGIIARDHLYFKTGAMTPTVPAFLLERKDTFWSPTGGFAEPFADGNLQLTDGETCFDLFRGTSLKEGSEELLLQENPSSHPKTVKQGDVTLSIRYTLGSAVPTAEFFVPLHLDLTATAIAAMIQNNTAPDAREHPSKRLVELTTGTKLKTFLQHASEFPGAFLYGPALLATMPRLAAAMRKTSKDRRTSMQSHLLTRAELTNTNGGSKGTTAAAR